MNCRWFIPIAILLPLWPFRLTAVEPVVQGRVATITINPGAVTVLHLRPKFESTIRMPEAVSSVILGSPSEFKAEHSAGEPDYVYVKPITKGPAQSNLLIATKSGQVVVLELITNGETAQNAAVPVDFLVEYHVPRSLLIFSAPSPVLKSAGKSPQRQKTIRTGTAPEFAAVSAIDEELAGQARINAPRWTRWEGRQIETSIGAVRQWGNETSVAYSVYNSSDRPVEILPPQIQISGRRAGRKKRKGRGSILSDPLEIRDYRLSASTLNPGKRADGVVVFDRPNFKESTEQLFLQIAQADQVNHPILIRLPFTPPIAADRQ